MLYRGNLDYFSDSVKVDIMFLGLVLSSLAMSTKTLVELSLKILINKKFLSRRKGRMWSPPYHLSLHTHLHGNPGRIPEMPDSNPRPETLSSLPL